MPDFDDLGTETQDDDQQLNNDGGAQDGTNPDDEGGEGEGEQFFLTVNDRTKYRTQQDAIKAFDEAGKRIAALSPWEKEVSQAFGGLTPQQTKAIVSEWIASKRAARNGSAAPAKTDGTPTESTPQMTAEQKEVVDFLKKNGFITKDEAAALRKEIDDLKNGTRQLQETTDSQRLSGLVEVGRTTLSAELAAAKLSPEKAKSFERYITAWVNEDEGRIERFYKGGEETKAIIKEGFKAVCEDFGITPAAQARPNLTAAQNKNKVLNRNPQRLPQSGSGSAHRSQKPANEGLTPNVHKQAADLFERIVNQGE